ncbi:MAG: biopolymer transporter ExbD [Notoacmeibacter sp.]|nr:biopolymer transporter ExbD [Notoacmeibacter sp.]
MTLRITIPRETRRASINLTPIMDVVFILVVFFLLAAQFADEMSQTLLLAPQGDSMGTETAAPAPARLLVEQAGYRLDGEVLTAERLAEALGALGGRSLAVEAANDAPYQALVTALDAAGKAGVGEVAIVPARPQGDGR